MADKIRLASVGLGWWGNVLADKVDANDSAEIVACYSRTEETRGAFAEKHGGRAANNIDDILKDSEIDGVLVATPHSHHPEIIAQLASAGKHMFVEKPLTMTVESSNIAIQQADKAGVVLAVGHHRRRQSANRRVKEMIDSGELGVLHQLEANLSNAAPIKKTWRGDPEEQPLGALTGMGIHMLDTLYYWAGPIKRVFCWSKKITGRDNLDDATASLVEFENGALGYIGYLFTVPKVCTAVAFGNQAAAWSEEEGGRLFFEKSGEMTRSELDVQPVDPLAEEIDEFARAIRGETEFETDGPSSLAAVEVMVASIESVKSGKPVDIADVR